MTEPGSVPAEPITDPRLTGPRLTDQPVTAAALAVVALGGALGSLARWALGELLAQPSGMFPWATLLTNVSGCLLLGVLVVWALERRRGAWWVRPFVGAGVLGGFTTFSTAMLDTRSLLVAGRPAVAAGYLLVSVVAGVAAVWLGIRLTRSATARGAP